MRALSGACRSQNDAAVLLERRKNHGFSADDVRGSKIRHVERLTDGAVHPRSLRRASTQTEISTPLPSPPPAPRPAEPRCTQTTQYRPTRLQHEARSVRNPTRNFIIISGRQRCTKTRETCARTRARANEGEQANAGRVLPHPSPHFFPPPPRAAPPPTVTRSGSRRLSRNARGLKLHEHSATPLKIQKFVLDTREAPSLRKRRGSACVGFKRSAARRSLWHGTARWGKGRGEGGGALEAAPLPSSRVFAAKRRAASSRTFVYIGSNICERRIGYKSRDACAQLPTLVERMGELKPELHGFAHASARGPLARRRSTDALRASDSARRREAQRVHREPLEPGLGHPRARARAPGRGRARTARKRWPSSAANGGPRVEVGGWDPWERVFSSLRGPPGGGEMEATGASDDVHPLRGRFLHAIRSRDRARREEAAAGTAEGGRRTEDVFMWGGAGGWGEKGSSFFSARFLTLFFLRPLFPLFFFQRSYPFL